MSKYFKYKLKVNEKKCISHSNKVSFNNYQMFKS